LMLERDKYAFVFDTNSNERYTEDEINDIFYKSTKQKLKFKAMRNKLGYLFKFTARRVKINNKLETRYSVEKVSFDISLLKGKLEFNLIPVDIDNQTVNPQKHSISPPLVNTAEMPELEDIFTSKEDNIPSWVDDLDDIIL